MWQNKKQDSKGTLKIFSKNDAETIQTKNFERGFS